MFGLFKKKVPEDNSQKWAAAMQQHGAKVADFGDYLADNPIGEQIVDQSVLPHPKDEILNSILFLLLTSNQHRDALLLSADTIAHFQKGVGKYPLFSLGFDMTKIDINKIGQAGLPEFIASHEAGRERYLEFAKLVEADRASIFQRIEAVDKSRADMLAKAAR